MGKLEEIKAKLSELSAEEIESLKSFLNSEPTEEKQGEEESKTEEVKQETTPVKESANTESEDTPASESELENKEEDTTSTETSVVDETPKVEETEETSVSEEPSEPVLDGKSEEPAPTTPAQEDDIPKMQRVGEPLDEDAVQPSENITTEAGEEIPVDYEQIIDGLNAKVAALEAENASLKNKVDGAFGYSAKASMPVKQNRLFDECSDIHIHR